MRNLSLSVLSGILLSTSYIPFYPWALFFCLVPLWSLWVNEKSIGKVFLYGWVTQFVFNMVGFHWIYHTATEFGHLPMIPSAIALIGFSCFASLDLPISGMFAAVICKRIQVHPLAKVMLFSIMFFLVQSFYPTIFPWNLGYPWLAAKWPAFQWADTVGFRGLSLLTYLFQCLFWYLWVNRNQARLVARGSVLFLAIFVALNITGLKKAQHEKERIASGDDLSVTIVQANIGNLEKAYAEKGAGYQDYIVERYLSLAEDALNTYPGTELIVFPETAIPISLNRGSNTLAEYVRAFTTDKNVPLITGSYADTEPRSHPYNSVFLISETGEIVDHYHKTHLLAFGEYLPFGDWFPVLYQWMPYVSQFSRGNGPKVIAFKELMIGPQICYEGLYPEFARAQAKMNANLFFNATNDSWFGKSFEPQQHLYMTLARAIEFRKPLIRATNTGISTVISSSGEIGEKSPIHDVWKGHYQVKVLKNSHATLYERFPNVIFFIATLIGIASILVGRRFV